jgi:transcriptional regulator with PAS, ATPase and Fis domain
MTVTVKKTLTAKDQPPRLVVRRFRLAVTAGPDKGKAFASEGERMVIGTQAPANALLGDPKVSRFQCEIRVDDGRVKVRDLGSRNGTIVDGVRVLEAELEDGQVLTVGETRLRFELGQQWQRIATSERARFGVLVGQSAAMRATFAVLERAAATDATVLLEGETGTGKEATAESIHAESARRDKPLVVVDCGALPANLVETELFGHERGAFTGSVGAREGAFELADGGTIFLDEIGELDADHQTKLLRALDKREVKRVGGKGYVPVNVRVIAATNRDLLREVNEKRFREDLYYRLAIVTVRLPPLRERLEDLPALVDALLAAEHALERPEAAALRTPAFLRELASHRWSGNVRELRNYLQRCLALGPAAAPVARREASATSDPLAGLPIDPDQPIRVVRDRWNSVLEKRYLEEVMRRCGGNVTAAAKAAGLGRVQLWRLLRRHGVS